jgi:hypothetical protein
MAVNMGYDATSLCLLCKWRQQVPSKPWLLSTKLQGVTCQETVMLLCLLFWRSYIYIYIYIPKSSVILWKVSTFGLQTTYWSPWVGASSLSCSFCFSVSTLVNLRDGVKLFLLPLGPNWRVGQTLPENRLCHVPKQCAVWKTWFDTKQQFTILWWVLCVGSWTVFGQMRSDGFWQGCIMLSVWSMSIV